MKLIGFVLIFASIAAGPTTKPTTAPASQPSRIPQIMAELRQQIKELQLQVLSLQKQLADVTAERDALKAAYDPPPPPKIRDAISEHRPVVGMTLPQLTQAGLKYIVTGDYTDYKDYKIQWVGNSVTRSHEWTARVENGRIVAVKFGK